MFASRLWARASFLGFLPFALFSTVIPAGCSSVPAGADDSATSASAASIPAQPAAVWTSEGGNILLNGQVFHLKGISWFGMETGGANLLGLGKRSITSILDALKAEDFNGLRIPMSVQWASDLNHVPANQGFTDDDADLVGKSWTVILDKLITEAGKRGMVVMLDMHTIGEGDNLTNGLWYSSHFNVCQFRQAWQNVLNLFGDRWNIFALDLKNEIFDVTWGTSEFDGTPGIDCKDGQFVNPAHRTLKPTDWRVESEKLIGELSVERTNAEGKRFRFQGLYVVPGIWKKKIGQKEWPYDGPGTDFWYGGNLIGLHNFPIRVSPQVAKQVAYSVHVYGPSVYPMKDFEDRNAYRVPSNMNSLYEYQNGFVESLTGRALIVGEWGGLNGLVEPRKDPNFAGKDDAAILSAIATWFPENCIADSFWWAVNPESYDTGGIFETTEYATLSRHRLDRARQMMPSPSRLALKTDGTVGFDAPGAFNAKCIEKMKNPKPPAGSLKDRCKTVNRDGTTCQDIGLGEGQQTCKWNQQWQCTNECLVWKGTCGTP
jgi:endoglucanase